MATEDKETLTIRLPKGLKELVDKAAEDRETTVTSIVREALQETLYPAVRMYEHPGLTKRFDDFLEKAVNKHVILLVADASTGHRYVLVGSLLPSPRNESLVALGGIGRPGWIIPRSDVVAWFEGAPGELQALTVQLARQGWAPRSGLTLANDALSQTHGRSRIGITLTSVRANETDARDRDERQRPTVASAQRAMSSHP